jgi:hypothetical protein
VVERKGFFALHTRESHCGKSPYFWKVKSHITTDKTLVRMRMRRLPYHPTKDKVCSWKVAVDLSQCKTIEDEDQDKSRH